MVIVGVTITRSRPSWAMARDPLFHLGFGIFCPLVCWFAWVINRRALRKQLEPRLEELEKLRRDPMAAG